jgi:hypothetical protein
MGGDIVRFLPLCDGSPLANCSFPYKDRVNLGQGDIHKLISIGTPHRGSPLANDLFSNASRPCTFLGVPAGTLGSHFQEQGVPIDLGAVHDLQDNSFDVLLLENSSPQFPIHFITGVANSNDELLMDAGLVAEVRKCDPSIVPSHIRDVFQEDSDLIVGVTSQKNNIADVNCVTRPQSNVVHSSAVIAKGQNPALFSTEEVKSQGVFDAVLNLLDTSDSFCH